jgi:hypothetical protein
MSIHVWPDERADAIPSRPNSTWLTASGVASMVMANSTPSAAPAGDTATLAPARAKDAVRGTDRFQTVTSWPAWSRRVAMGVPMVPRPRKAILDTV